MKLWEKGIETKDFVLDFTIGNDYLLDLEMAREDVLASMAHAVMLSETGLLDKNERSGILRVLKHIFKEIDKGNFVIEKGSEDIHSQVEKILIEKLGEAGKKIHTARSRNDQVITDLKLFYRISIVKLASEIKTLAEKLIDQAVKHKDVELPGFTHLQAAMPSSFGLWFGAYAESLAEDLQFLHGTFRYVNQNPLGSAAGFGSSFPIDRKLTTELLEFEGLHINSVNAQMSRGKTERFLMSGLAGVSKTLSTMAMDLVLYMNQNFGFVSLRDDFTTGSSIMPHKKNPDILELIRAKANRIQSGEFEVLSVTANLPSGYHRDMQVLKDITFPAVAELFSLIYAFSLVLDNIEVHAVTQGKEEYRYLGTVDAMSRKVMQGVAYRDAYRQIAEEIENGQYNPSERIPHTHIGSAGNPGFEEIRNKLEKEWVRFEAEKYLSFPERFICKINNYL